MLSRCVQILIQTIPIYFKTVFPAKRFMVAKKKRSLNAHHSFDSSDNGSAKLKNFEHRFTANAQRF